MSATTRIDFLYLNEPDMIRAGVTDMAACVDTMEEMFGLLGVGDYRMAGPDNNSHGAMVFFPAEPEHEGMPADGPDRRFMAMPAYLGGSFRTTGCKWYGSNVANKEQGLPRSILMFTLSDKDTGAPLAIMSANLLSAYRTGAIPGVGARHLARTDARVVGIVGPGVMNRTSFESYMVARPGIELVKVFGRGRASIDGFTAFVAEKWPHVRVEIVGTAEAAVRDSDIVSIATSSISGSEHYPYIAGEWLKPGAFVSLPAHIRFDDATIDAVRNVCDSRSLYTAWAEELPSPTWELVGLHGMRLVDRIEAGEMDASKMEDLGEIIAGLAPGRRSDDEIILYSVGGMPVEDVAWGTKVYRTALERGIGTQLNLWETPALA